MRTRRIKSSAMKLRCARWQIMGYILRCAIWPIAVQSLPGQTPGRISCGLGSSSTDMSMRRLATMAPGQLTFPPCRSSQSCPGRPTFWDCVMCPLDSRWDTAALTSLPRPPASPPFGGIWRWIVAQNLRPQRTRSRLVPHSSFGRSRRSAHSRPTCPHRRPRLDGPTLIDVSRIAGVAIDDEVVLIGRSGQEQITAWDIARALTPWSTRCCAISPNACPAATRSRHFAVTIYRVWGQKVHLDSGLRNKHGSVIPPPAIRYRVLQPHIFSLTYWREVGICSEADRLKAGEAVIQHPSLLQPDIQVSCVPVSQN